MMRIGVFFGGQSREREISFSGARTFFESIDTTLFEPVPIFVDSHGNFILLDERFLKETDIRSFYPPKTTTEGVLKGFNIYVESIKVLTDEQLSLMASKIGHLIRPTDFKKYFDFGFILLHGPYGEDGSLQGLLEWYNIPYSGSGILGSAMGIDKYIQKQFLTMMSLDPGRHKAILKKDYLRSDKKLLFESLKKDVGFPFVVKAPYQGSSIGVSIVKQDDLEVFKRSMNKALFSVSIAKDMWQGLNQQEKEQYVRDLIDLDKGIGLPVIFSDESLLAGDLGEVICYRPYELIQKLDDYFSYAEQSATLTSFDSEELVLFEAFLKGKEFSCGVIQDEHGKPVALPPTEIISHTAEGFDYNAKYKPGGSSKKIPIGISVKHIEEIQAICRRAFVDFKYNVCVRIDGFFTEDNKIVLIDTNTVPGMSPTSLIFRQAAEIGLNATQFLTYIIRTSLAERVKTGKKPYHLLAQLRNLDVRIQNMAERNRLKPKSAIIMTGFNKDKNSILETARRIYTNLCTSRDLQPIVLLMSDSQMTELYTLPISYLLKPTLSDVIDALKQPLHPAIAETIEKASNITQKYAPDFNPLPQQVTYFHLQGKIKAVYLVGETKAPSVEKLKALLQNDHTLCKEYML
ncbi:MAG: D-alanine--D-alanine ligase [Cytophagales bacterium]|nr:MAG: D-alanine--D-alanine ligase [Cytophagales bacterium]TAF60646.1 MAG: D-alanine--D-alanine ligase [Cytophagales bacterium]